ncbi:hypothetical protein [Flagellimonas onchidii]|nr:hypothetical protein [Allomuricauda onchidii]
MELPWTGSTEARGFRIKRRLKSPPSLFASLKATEGVGGAGGIRIYL